MSISPNKKLNSIERKKSLRDLILSHASTLFALVLNAAIGGVVVYLTGADFTEYMTELGLAGIVLQKIVQDTIVPYLNRYYNFKRV